MTVALSTYSYSIGDPSVSLDVDAVFRPGDVGVWDGVNLSRIYRFSIWVK